MIGELSSSLFHLANFGSPESSCLLKSLFEFFLFGLGRTLVGLRSEFDSLYHSLIVATGFVLN